MAPFSFPCYQIDFSSVGSGKRLSATKRRIRWRFGFPNKAALDEGKTGTDCRGDEHELILVWSIASGKRQILMDGKEVHYLKGRTTLFEHSWNSFGTHVMKVVCHISPPMEPSPGFRQYDFMIDGQSFFTMPKVFELGLKSPTFMNGRMPGAVGGYSSSRNANGGRNEVYTNHNGSVVAQTPRNETEEDDELQRAIKASLEESRQYMERKGISSNASAPPGGPAPYTGPSGMTPAPAPTAEDLLDFMSDAPSSNLSAPPIPAAPVYTSAPVATAYGGPPGQQQHQQALVSYASPSAQQQSYPGAPPPPQPQYQEQYQETSPPPAPPPPQPSYDVFHQPAAPSGEGTLLSPESVAPNDPFAPKPASHNDIANEILNAYGGSANGVSTPMGAPTSPPPQQQQQFEQPHLANGGTNLREDHVLEKQSSNQGVLSMNGDLNPALEEAPLSDAEQALKKLVNLDHINEAPEAQVKLTMKRKEENTKKTKNGKSRPLPPAAQGYVGNDASLQQIKEVKPTSNKPKENIMKAPPTSFHPQAAAAGAMVLYGAEGGGPPPLQQQAGGFGVVYQEQQRQLYYQQQQHMSPPAYPPQQQQPQAFHYR